MGSSSASAILNNDLVDDGCVVEINYKIIGMALEMSFKIPFSLIHTRTFLLGCAMVCGADTNEQVGMEAGSRDAGMGVWWTTRPSA